MSFTTLAERRKELARRKVRTSAARLHPVHRPECIELLPSDWLVRSLSAAGQVEQTKWSACLQTDVLPPVFAAVAVTWTKPRWTR